MDLSVAQAGRNAYPPGPRPGWFGFPILRDFQRDPLAQLDRLHREFGDAVSYRIGPYRQFFFFHPDAVRELLVTKAKSFRRFRHPLKVLRQWNGESLIVVEGDSWLRKRRLLQPAFQPKRLAAYLPPMANETSRLAARWLGLLDRSAGGEVTIDVQPDMNALSLNIISQTMFGSDLTPSAGEINAAVTLLSSLAVDEMQSPFILPRWLPLPYNFRKNAAIRQIDRTVRQLIDQHERAQQPPADLLTALLTHTEIDEQGREQRLDREEIRNETVTLLLAGHDTTAAGLVWTLYHLAANPQLQAQARDEVLRVVGQRQLTTELVEQLGVLDRIIKESLRLHPPAVGVFFRQAEEDVAIGGWQLRKGELAGTYSWVVQRDERWYPDPERFDPDRFLPERVEQLSPGAYFPFGAGPRACIGQRMASLEMLVVVATLLPSFELHVPAEAPPPRPVLLFSLRPEGGMRLVVKRVLQADPPTGRPLP